MPPTDLPDQLRDQLQNTLGTTYTLERELGGGGMSRVFVAREESLGRDVVVKVLAPELAQGLSAERFAREIKLAAALQEPHIVPVLTAGATADGLPFYTMPLVEGESLRARIGRGPIPFAEGKAILRNVAQALAYAHARGIVHRDIKPENVMLSSGTAVVLDFGIAKALQSARTVAPDGPGALTHEGLTQIGTSLGTPAYMAPEQAAGDAVDARADLYAWGVMAYELFSGRHMFAGKTTAQQLIAAHIAELPRALDGAAPSVPTAVVALVMRCLAKDPAKRPASAAELLSELDNAVILSDAGATRTTSRLGLARALALSAFATIAVALLARAAMLVFGLPDWVLPGALIVMACAFVAIGAAWRRGRAERMTMWGTAALGAYAVIVVAYMVLRALGIGPAGSLLAAGKLGARPRLLVAEFGAPAADSTLGRVVAEAVKTSLGQSRVVEVVPASAVSATLERMRRPADARLNVATAREVAQREGVAAVVTGDVAPLGGGAFLLTTRLLDAATGDELASAQETARAPDDLIPAIDRATRTLRGRLGESLRTVRATPTLARVTTASLAALREYEAGLSANNRQDFLGAVPHAERAIAIDSGFASAYKLLATSLSNAGAQPDRVEALNDRAYALRDRLPDAERLRVTLTRPYRGRHSDPERALALADSLVALDTASGLHYLGNLRWLRGDFALAESAYRREIALAPTTVAWDNVVRMRLTQRRLAAAESAQVLMAAAGFTPPLLRYYGAIAAYLRGRPDSASELAQRAAAVGGFESSYALPLAMELEEVRGRLASSHALRAELARAVGRLGNDTLALRDSIEIGLEDVWLRGEPARARERVAGALRARPIERVAAERRPYLELAALIALTGDAAGARRWLARFDADVHDPEAVRVAQPLRHEALADIALAERRWDDALRERDLAALDVGGAPSFATTAAREFGRGTIQALAGRTDDAIASLERALVANFANDGIPPDNLFRASTYQQLGQLYETKGDVAKALDYYGRFVTLWKDADPELQPRLAEVRKRIARLRAHSG